VLFGTGVAMMGSVEVTMLHHQRMGDPMLPPTLEVVPSSLEDSSRGYAEMATHYVSFP
jgi:hypothetical protein